MKEKKKAYERADGQPMKKPVAKPTIYSHKQYSKWSCNEQSYYYYEAYFINIIDRSLLYGIL